MMIATSFVYVCMNDNVYRFSLNNIVISIGDTFSTLSLVGILVFL